MRATWAWRHKTKVVGTTILAGGYLQAHLVDVGKAIPPHAFAVIVSASGIVVTVLGFVNLFLPPEDSP